MQSATYFLRLMMNLVGRTYSKDSRMVITFLSISWMWRSALWQWESGVVWVIDVWRRPRGVARERHMGSESVQNLRTEKP